MWSKQKLMNQPSETQSNSKTHQVKPFYLKPPKTETRNPIKKPEKPRLCDFVKLFLQPCCNIVIVLLGIFQKLLVP